MRTIRVWLSGKPGTQAEHGRSPHKCPRKFGQLYENMTQLNKMKLTLYVHTYRPMTTWSAIISIDWEYHPPFCNKQ